MHHHHAVLRQRNLEWQLLQRRYVVWREVRNKVKLGGQRLSALPRGPRGEGCVVIVAARRESLQLLHRLQHLGAWRGKRGRVAQAPWATG